MSMRPQLARPALALAMLILASAAGAAGNDFPKLKPGEWEFTRQGFNGPANAQNLSVRECIDPAQSMREQNAMLAQAGCRFDPVQAAGNVYTYAAQCDIPSVGKTRSVSVLTRQSDTAYTVKVDSEGEINGKPMKTSELLTARRVGNCKVPKSR
jgi:hypothetical protein